MMKTRSTYQAAKEIAPFLEKHFREQISSAEFSGEQCNAFSPNSKVIESIIDVAFWASLRKEEGHSPRISIAFLSPSQTENPLYLGKRLELTPHILTKVASGVERAGIHLGVWIENDELYIWGTTQNIPNYCFVLDVSEPGLLVIKHRRIYGFGKFTNVAILKGDEIKIINEATASFEDSPKILHTLLGNSLASLRNDAVNILIQLAVSMRSHGHGGILLIVPNDKNSWEYSIVHPMQYAIIPPFKALADLIKNDGNGINESLWLSVLRKEVDHIAGLSAIDGATIINEDYELLAFGAKITRLEGNQQVRRITLIEPIVGGEEKIVYPGQLGGTRHLSAAQFVYDQHDSLALVASQDGHFTVFSWSQSRSMVQAHRIDSLLL
jgi:hypothetical protein